MVTYFHTRTGWWRPVTSGKGACDVGEVDIDNVEDVCGVDVDDARV